MHPPRPTSSDYWEVELGPFHLVKGVAGWLGVFVSTIHRRIGAHQIVVLKARDGILRLPAFQFNEDGSGPSR
jgi:hypothetical protein